MFNTRMSLLTAMGLAACSGPGEASLFLTSDVSSFDGRTEHAVLKVRAFTATGAVGQGAVSLVAGAGHFVGGAEISLSDGLGTATYVCDPAEDAACSGLLRLGATWAGLSANVQVRVTPSSAVTSVKWKAVPTNTLSELRAIAVGPSGKLWAVGSSGAVVALTSSAWAGVPSGTFADLLAVSFAPTGEGFVVGRQGTLLVEGATGLQAVTTGIESDLTSVYAVTATDVAVGARDGTLYRFNGAVLTNVGTLGAPVLSLAANGGQLWAGGEGALAVWASGAWTPSTMPVQAQVSVATGSPEGLWLGGSRIGASGGVLMLGPTDWRTFDLTGRVTSLAVVPDSVERFVITQDSVLRQTGVGGPWSPIESPMGGNAAASRATGDLVIVGPPGLSLLRE